jgi:hypothetical protein
MLSVVKQRQNNSFRYSQYISGKRLDIQDLQIYMLGNKGEGGIHTPSTCDHMGDFDLAKQKVPTYHLLKERLCYSSIDHNHLIPETTCLGTQYWYYVELKLSKVILN